MSKKLLSESQVRRFQGLAGIPSIHEMGMYGDRDEEELPGDEGPGEELPPDLGGEFGGEEDVGLADLEPSDEGGEGLDLDLSPEEKEGLAADIVRAVADELEHALRLDEPIEVDVEGGEGDLEDLEGLESDVLDVEMAPEEEEDVLGLKDPPGVREPPGGGLREDNTANKGHGPGKQVKDGNGHPTGRWLKEDEEESIEEGEDEELAEVIDDEAVVNEVFRRVIARLSNNK